MSHLTWDSETPPTPVHQTLSPTHLLFFLCHPDIRKVFSASQLCEDFTIGSCSGISSPMLAIGQPLLSGSRRADST